MRKTISCTWPTVMRVSTGSEWRKPSRWEHLDSGVEEGGCVWDLGDERGAPTMKDTEGEDIGKHYTAQPVILFSHAQSIDLAASSARGESMTEPWGWLC